MIPISKPQISQEEEQAIIKVMRSGRLAQGPKVAEFEERFADYVGARYGVACGNGTQALMLALLAHGIGPGDEVITTPFTFVATASAVMMVGTRPVFVDVEEETGNLDTQQARNTIVRQLPRHKAVIPVHLYGHPCNVGQLWAMMCSTEFPCQTRPVWENGIVIYDACQAHGARADGTVSIGYFGTSCFSFYATKNLTCGEGGMVTTNDADIADRLRSLRNHGQGARYHYQHLGYNFRMTEMQAAIGLVQLSKLPEMQAARQANAEYLMANLEGVITPTVQRGCTHAWHQYTIRVPGGREKRDALQAYLAEKGIGTGIYYPLPLHLQPVFAHLGYKIGDFPIAEKLSGEVLSLPVHPGLSCEDLGKITEAVNEWTN